MVIKHLANNFGLVQEYDIYKILKKYNIELTEDEALSIADEFGMDLSLFDGSVKNTIKTLMNDLSINIDKIITNTDANKEIKAYLQKYLEKQLYFNKSDINNKKIEHIINFIDREFDPADDNELVKIYRKIQDMTIEEFKKEILPKTKAEDLGIKSVTGYEILKKIQRYDEKTNTDFMNTVYFDSLVKETQTKIIILNINLTNLQEHLNS